MRCAARSAPSTGPGAECSPVWNGYMEGAVRSGESTADDVLAAVG